MESILQKERSLTDLERETFFRRLGLLLQGGLPILRALGALEGHSGPAVKKLCRSLARSLGRGFSLSQALRQQERQAGNLAAPLAAAGEASGQLPLVFRHLANFYQKKRENQKTVLQACLYPALVLTLALVLDGVFCWLALPLLGDLYGTLGLVPPAGFRLLLALVIQIRDRPWLLGGALALGILGFRQLWKSREKWMARLPLVKPLVQGGLPLDRALPQAGEILPPGPFRRCARQLEWAVVAGASLTAAARNQTLLLSPLTVEFAALGEASGHLPALLSEAARLLDQDFQARLKQLRTLLEPVLLLVLALGCAGMLAGLLSPLFALLQGLPLLP